MRPDWPVAASVPMPSPVVDLAGVQAVVQHADVAIGPLREAAVWLSPHWRWWSLCALASTE